MKGKMSKEKITRIVLILVMIVLLIFIYITQTSHTIWCDEP